MSADTEYTETELKDAIDGGGKFAETCNVPIPLIQITLDSFGSVRLP